MLKLDSTSDYVEFYLTKLRAGDFETAFHALSEVGHSVVPMLIAAFRQESKPAVRAELVNIIWNHRRPETLAFLGEALSDSNAEVWKSALDGLVTLASPTALGILQTALSRQLPSRKQTEQFQKWVQEAITQVKENMGFPLRRD
jgi:HEAT repeat protein